MFHDYEPIAEFGRKAAQEARHSTDQDIYMRGGLKTGQKQENFTYTYD